MAKSHKVEDDEQGQKLKGQNQGYKFKFKRQRLRSWSKFKIIDPMRMFLHIKN